MFRLKKGAGLLRFLDTQKVTRTKGHPQPKEGGPWVLAHPAPFLLLGLDMKKVPAIDGSFIAACWHPEIGKNVSSEKGHWNFSTHISRKSYEFK